MNGWLWMLCRFDARRVWRYWREGRRRGWMTSSQSQVVMDQFSAWRDEGRSPKEITDAEIAALLERAGSGRVRGGRP